MKKTDDFKTTADKIFINVLKRSYHSKLVFVFWGFLKLFFKYSTLGISALRNKKRNSQYLMETESDSF